MTPAIETRGLTKRFGKKHVINGLDLTVHRGSIYGLLGKNGSGKSTTIQMLMGLIDRGEGSVSVLGLDPEKQDVELKDRVGYVPENHNFHDWLSVGQTIGLAAYYFKNWDAKLAEKLLLDFNFEEETKVGALSKGARAKLSMLLALCHKPELLILDEPLGGLDPGARRALIQGVLQYIPDKGCTIFISSHLVNEISTIVDWVGLLKDGTLLLSERTDQILESMKLVRLVFAEGNRPDGINCPGILRSSLTDKSIQGLSAEREVLLVFREFDPEKTLERLRIHSPSDIEIKDLTLEDVFIELLPDKHETIAEEANR